MRGGRPFDKTSLHRLLTNPIYLGKVRHRGEEFKGEHEAIVDEAVWNSVQQMLLRNSRNGGAETRNKYGALLRGLIRCGSCDVAMGHVFTRKGTKPPVRTCL